MIPRLKEAYSKEIQPALKESLGLKEYIYDSKSGESSIEYGTWFGWSRCEGS